MNDVLGAGYLCVLPSSRAGYLCVYYRQVMAVYIAASHEFSDTRSSRGGKLFSSIILIFRSGTAIVCGWLLHLRAFFTSPLVKAGLLIFAATPSIAASGDSLFSSA